MRLKELREDKDMSLVQLCKDIDGIGVNYASYSRWENGIADIRSDQLLILAKYFGVSADYLLGLEE